MLWMMIGKINLKSVLDIEKFPNWHIYFLGINIVYIIIRRNILRKIFSLWKRKRKSLNYYFSKFVQEIFNWNEDHVIIVINNHFSIYIKLKRYSCLSKRKKISEPLKVLLGYIPKNSNTKSLACDTANERTLTCTSDTCSYSQKAVQWNKWRWSIHIYRNGREHYSDSWLPHVCTYLSTPGNTAKLGTAHSNIYRQHKVVRPWLERIYNALVSTLLSQAISTLCQSLVKCQNITLWM